MSKLKNITCWDVHKARKLIRQKTQKRTRNEIQYNKLKQQKTTPTQLPPTTLVQDIKKLLTHSMRHFYHNRRLIFIYVFIAVKTDRRDVYYYHATPLLIPCVGWNSVIAMGYRSRKISTSGSKLTALCRLGNVLSLGRQSAFVNVTWTSDMTCMCFWQIGTVRWNEASCIEFVVTRAWQRISMSTQRSLTDRGVLKASLTQSHNITYRL